MLAHFMKNKINNRKLDSEWFPTTLLAIWLFSFHSMTMFLMK